MSSCSRATCGLQSVGIFDHVIPTCLTCGCVSIDHVSNQRSCSELISQRDAAVLERQGSGNPHVPTAAIAYAEGRVPIQDISEPLHVSIMSSVGGLCVLHPPLHLAPEHGHVTASRALRAYSEPTSILGIPQNFKPCPLTMSGSSFEVDGGQGLAVGGALCRQKGMHSRSSSSGFRGNLCGHRGLEEVWAGRWAWDMLRHP